LIISACGGFVEGKCPSSVALSKQFYRITKMACNPDTRQDVITILVAYAEHAYENMGDVLSYMVALDTEDASVLVVFERYPTADLAKAAGSDEAARRAMDKVKDGSRGSGIRVQSRLTFFAVNFAQSRTGNPRVPGGQRFLDQERGAYLIPTSRDLALSSPVKNCVCVFQSGIRSPSLIAARPIINIVTLICGFAQPE
jgi:quinol monooxygenase YgiN